MPRDEAMRTQTDADDPSRDYEAYPLKCWACEARDLAMRDAVDANKGRPMPGMHWAVVERNGST